MLSELDQVKGLLDFSRKIVILTHRNPDGDAIGSSLAMKYFLEARGHHVQVIFPSDAPPLFNYLPAIRDTLIADVHTKETEKWIETADVLFCLDFNALDRVQVVAQVYREAKGYKIMIDHHLDPEPIADYMLSDPGASSTCELVYLFLEKLGALGEITQDIAQALFTGLLTDTGSFKFSTSPRLFRIAAALKETGVDDYWLQNRIFQSMSEKQLRLLGHCLANRMEIMHAYLTGIIYLNKQDYQDFHIQRGDTEGIVNYILMIRHIRVAAFITEQANVIKLSFRSKGNISVQELARTHFNGGGHKNASGGSSNTTLMETIDKFKSILPEYLQHAGITTS